MHARTGTALLPWHGGRAPAWLLSRMVKLAPELTRLVKFGEERAKRRRRERQLAADAQPPLPEG